MKRPQEMIEKPRQWQVSCKEEALLHWRRGEREYFAEACPGAGKTWFALDMVVSWMEAIGKGKVVIVVPTDNLRLQWMNEATKFDIALDNEFNGAYQLSDSFHGVVQTYATVANNPYAFKSLISSGGIVVLDEIHHAGDQLAWGEGLLKAFDDVYNKDFKMLLLSGTPFRSDNAMIPFARYKSLGDGVMQSDPNYRYGYDQALADGVVRYVVFPAYEGETTWMDEMGMRSVSFDDKVSRDDASKRLTTAQLPSEDNEYMVQMIRDAHDKLMHVRRTHSNAGGLVVARDVEHARSMAALMKKVIGIDPVVVTYKDSNQNTLLKANQKIDAFRKSRDPWIIAVNMVSEGVDIQRLRVGLYASNVKTALFLIQVIGRIIRMINGIKEQTAYFYFPKDKDFIDVISDLQKQRDHFVYPEDEDNDDEGGELGISSDGGDGEPPVFVPVSGFYTGHINEFEGQTYLPWEVSEARELAEAFGLDVDPVRLAAALRHKNKTSFDGPISEPPKPIKAVAVKRQHKALRAEHNRLVNSLCHYMQNSPDGLRELRLADAGYARYGGKDKAHRATQVYKKDKTGIYNAPASMTLEELETVIKWLSSEVAKWKVQS